MKFLLFLLELFLLFTMLIFVGEYKFNLLDTLLQSKDIKAAIYFKDFDILEIKELKIKNKELARKIELKFRYQPLLKNRVYFSNILINRLNLNTLKSIETKKSSKNSINLSFFIKKLKADAIYTYKGINKAHIKIEDATIKKASIRYLFIDSFFGRVEAKGDYNSSLNMKGSIFLKEEFLKGFKTSLNLKNFKKLDFIAKVDKKMANFSFKTDIKNIYKDANFTLKSKGVYNFDSNSLKTTNFIDFNFLKSYLNAKADISYKKRLSFKGKGIIKNKNYNIPVKYSFYKDFNLKFFGDLKSANILVYNQFFKSDINYTKDFIKLSTSKIFFNSLFDKLSKELQNSYFKIDAKKDKNITAKIFSDILYATINFDKTRVDMKAKFLKKINNLNLKALNPIYIKGNLLTKEIEMFTKLFTIKTQQNRGILKIANSTIEATYKKDINIKAKINSLKKILTTLSPLYYITKKPIDAKFTLKAKINPKTYRYTTQIISPFINFNSKTISYFNILTQGEKNELFINYYAIAFNNRAIYSTKTSHIIFDKDLIRVKEFWIEEGVKLFGYLTKESAKLKINAKNYQYSSTEGSLNLDSNLTLHKNGEKISVEGDILLNRGELNIKPKKEHSILDEDIVIVDDKSKTDYFKKNVALNIKVEAKKPIFYKINYLKIAFLPDLLIWKEYEKDLELLGYIDIIDGSYYALDEYKILKSKLYFYSKPTDPLLDIHIKVKKDSYTIFITISGPLSNPILSFDSEPYLEQKDILSLLIFNSNSQNLLLKAGGGDRLISAFGNIFLKDMLKDMGISLDRLSLVLNERGVGFEIGKRISDKINIIYKNDEVSTIIINYEINDKIESEIILSPKKNGANIFYKEVR